MGSLRLQLIVAALSLASALVVHSQSSSGFISIDCGKPEGSSYNDSSSGLLYTSDFQYIDTGEIRSVNSKYKNGVFFSRAYDLRSFPNGTRNCYSIKPVEQGRKYLVRAAFMYGNYDGRNKAPEFDLYLGVNFWSVVSFPNISTNYYYDVMAIATSKSMSICLVNTDSGTPFISYIELRILPNDLYTQLNSSQALRSFSRTNLGGRREIWYPDDSYDRIWDEFELSGWESITTSLSITTTKGFEPPMAVMRTASAPANGTSSLSFVWESTADPRNQKPYFYIFMHFAELQLLNVSDQIREFSISINGEKWSETNIRPVYRETTTVYSTYPKNYDQISVKITNTNASTMPPFLNAIEILQVLDFSGLETDSGDVAAMMEIKDLYGLKRNWAGDPCAPKDFIWEGLNCSYSNLSSPRIILLNLSSSNLTGEIPNSVGNLTQLQYLDLSINGLAGEIPEFLENLPDLKFLDLTGTNISGPIPKKLQDRMAAGALTLRMNTAIDSCGYSKSCKGNSRKSTKKVVIAIVASIGSALLIVIIILFFMYGWKRRNHLGPRSNQKIEDNHRIHINPENEPQIPVFQLDKRQFTYNDLAKITRNFCEEIGKGGFGSVYHGIVENNIPVAVKVLSKASSQGPKQFQNEAILLTRIHHKNLVSLVGYCNEPNHLALVYEFMEKGSLDDHLSGKVGNMNAFSWKKRLQIATNVAQGLEYLHIGCKTAIVHRDVKTTNILLSRDMDAKLADFGLSRIFSSDIQTYVSTIVMGTPGYVDPEYFETQKLNEKSDVYSFGIVLLQLITGRPAIVSNDRNTHIVDWVLPWFEKGAIEEIVDRRLQSMYDINSVWRALEIALTCVAPLSTERPAMSVVSIQLKECLELEELLEKHHNSAQSSSGTGSTTSISRTPMNKSEIFNLEVR